MTFSREVHLDASCGEMSSRLPARPGFCPFTRALTRCAGKSQGTSALWGSSHADGTRDFHDRQDARRHRRHLQFTVPKRKYAVVLPSGSNIGPFVETSKSKNCLFGLDFSQLAWGACQLGRWGGGRRPSIPFSNQTSSELPQPPCIEPRATNEAAGGSASAAIRALP